MTYEATQDDWDGLFRLQEQIAWRDRGQPVEVRCFQREEADWLRDRLLFWRPSLRNRLRMTWLEFRGA